MRVRKQRSHFSFRPLPPTSGPLTQRQLLLSFASVRMESFRIQMGTNHNNNINNNAWQTHYLCRSTPSIVWQTRPEFDQTPKLSNQHPKISLEAAMVQSQLLYEEVDGGLPRKLLFFLFWKHDEDQIFITGGWDCFDSTLCCWECPVKTFL